MSVVPLVAGQGLCLTGAHYSTILKWHQGPLATSGLRRQTVRVRVGVSVRVRIRVGLGLGSMRRSGGRLRRLPRVV